MDRAIGPWSGRRASRCLTCQQAAYVDARKGSRPDQGPRRVTVTDGGSLVSGLYDKRVGDPRQPHTCQA